MNRVFLSQWIKLRRRFLWLVGMQEIWIIALLTIKLWITLIGVFLIDVSAPYRPIHTIKWKTHNLTHRRFLWQRRNVTYVFRRITNLLLNDPRILICCSGDTENGQATLGRDFNGSPKTSPHFYNSGLYLERFKGSYMLDWC